MLDKLSALVARFDEVEARLLRPVFTMTPQQRQNSSKNAIA